MLAPSLHTSRPMTDRRLLRFRRGAVFAIGTLVLVAAAPAQAYVGPGAGLSLLGALWGVAAALVAALAFVVIWPLRRMIARRSARSRMAGDPPTPGQRPDRA